MFLDPFDSYTPFMYLMDQLLGKFVSERIGLYIVRIRRNERSIEISVPHFMEIWREGELALQEINRMIHKIMWLRS